MRINSKDANSTEINNTTYFYPATKQALRSENNKDRSRAITQLFQAWTIKFDSFIFNEASSRL